MDIFSEIVVARLMFILGITNLVAVTLIFLSCRCIPELGIIGKLMKYRVYQRFYKYHCYIWWALWISVVIHAILGITYLGIPFWLVHCGSKKH